MRAWLTALAVLPAPALLSALDDPYDVVPVRSGSDGLVSRRLGSTLPDTVFPPSRVVPALSTARCFSGRSKLVGADVTGPALRTADPALVGRRTAARLADRGATRQQRNRVGRAAIGEQCAKPAGTVLRRSVTWLKLQLSVFSRLPPDDANIPWMVAG